MMAHTPGPWVVVPGIKSGPEETPPSIHTEPGRLIASMGYSITEMAQNAEANAHLIAAAPDLLRALEEILGLLEHRPMVHLNAAKVAIAKAKGKIN